MSWLERRDTEKREAAAAKNDLESYIIATGSSLDDASIEQVCSPLLVGSCRPLMIP
jgi:hypothetical protein